MYMIALYQVVHIVHYKSDIVYIWLKVPNGNFF